jgi:glutamyl-Q tRNA(Asp) synthetase
MYIVARFAPSPTGYLHLGHAASALHGWRQARRSGGRFLLRLEDIDAARCRPEYAAAVQADLAWLGLDWDGPVRVQSHHLDEYRAVLDRLAADQLLYPCFCTRADILRQVAAAAAAPHAPDGSPLYPGTCRDLMTADRADRIAAGTPFALRLDVTEAMRRIPSGLSYFEAAEGRVICRPEQFGDVVLGRKEVPASYHLCVAHDDAHQGVTLVTRGVDLKPATDLHRLIQALMDWPAPVYAHHALLVDAQGRRLAKRDKAATLRDMRAAGVTADDVTARVSNLTPPGIILPADWSEPRPVA